VSFSVIHRCPPGGPIPEGAAAWRTCLREVVFVQDVAPAASDDEVVLSNEAAYGLLVEIVSGLRSPLIGETEVQAQFKAFLASLDGSRSRWLQRLGQRVLADAKQVRRRHFQGFGAHSYAELAGAYLTAPRTVIVGTGALAQKVLSTRHADALVDVWGRSADKRPDAACTLRFHLYPGPPAWDRACDEPVAVVIAAPVDDASLDAVLSHYATIAVVVDLRAADQVTPLPASLRVVTLSDLFMHANRGASDAPSRVNAAKADIRALARAYAGREELHPFGWDDLCA
jgi:glutamyl-tRNA reductase